MTGEGRERFLKDIAARVPAHRVEEVHLFPAIRQGGRESGVAVIAVRPGPVSEPSPPAPLDVTQAAEPPERSSTLRGACEPPDDSWLDTDTPLVAGEHPAANAAERVEIEPAVEAEPQPRGAPPPPRRLTIFRARYRLTLKGAERGKWEMDLTEEADAPASTVDEVVRGVHRRAGEESEPERLTGEAFRAALSDEPWTAARR
jgi:hypothetical protein